MYGIKFNQTQSYYTGDSIEIYAITGKPYRWNPIDIYMEFDSIELVTDITGNSIELNVISGNFIEFNLITGDSIELNLSLCRGSYWDL